MKYFASVFCSLIICGQLFSQDKLTPEISPYGQMSAVPGATVRADKKMRYNVVAEIKSSDTLSNEVNASLDVLARYVNMLSYDGVKKDRRSIVVIVHNMGSYIVQNNEAYQRKYGHSNPNADLIRQLSEAGVSFMICGQSAVKRKVTSADMLPGVQLATSFLTAFTTLQLKGYATLSL